MLISKIYHLNLGTFHFRHFKLLLSFIFFTCAIPFISCSKSPTDPKENRPQIEVTEDITEDTVWESGNDYIISDLIKVNKNIILTIEGDVNVYFKNNTSLLNILGYIVTLGTVDNYVFFRPDPNNVFNEQIGGLTINNNENKMQFKYCDFTNCSNGIEVINSKIEISQCNFKNCHTGIYCEKNDSLLISSNLFEGNEYSIKIERAQNDFTTYIENNKFTNCKKIGCEVNNYASFNIIKNIFKDCVLAIQGNWYSKMSVQYNDFINCKTAINLNRCYDVDISNNNLLSGEIGINIYISTPTINNNNLLNLNKYKIKLNVHSKVEKDIDAKKNWWNTLDLSTINQSIWDAYDDTKNVGYVQYEPIETKYIENIGIH